MIVSTKCQNAEKLDTTGTPFIPARSKTAVLGTVATRRKGLPAANAHVGRAAPTTVNRTVCTAGSVGRLGAVSARLANTTHGSHLPVHVADLSSSFAAAR